MREIKQLLLFWLFVFIIFIFCYIGSLIILYNIYLGITGIIVLLSIPLYFDIKKFNKRKFDKEEVWKN